MKRRWMIGVLGFTIFFTFSCDYVDLLVRDGENIQKNYSIEKFNRVILDTSVRLVLDNDSSYSASAEGADFLLSRLKVVQREDVLYIESEGSVGFRQKEMPVVTITSPDFSYVRSNFPSEITNADTLEVRGLRIIISGRGAFTECNLRVDAESVYLGAFGSNNGDHIIKGKTNVLKVISMGLTSLDASELIAGKASYYQSSVNPGYVNVTNSLNVQMASSGNVYYSGTVDTSIVMGNPLYEVELGEVICVSK